MQIEERRKSQAELLEKLNRLAQQSQQLTGQPAAAPSYNSQLQVSPCNLLLNHEAALGAAVYDAPYGIVFGFGPMHNALRRLAAACTGTPVHCLGPSGAPTAKLPAV